MIESQYCATLKKKTDCGRLRTAKGRKSGCRRNRKPQQMAVRKILNRGLPATRTQKIRILHLQSLRNLRISIERTGQG